MNNAGARLHNKMFGRLERLITLLCTYEKGDWKKRKKKEHVNTIDDSLPRDKSE